MGNTVCSKQYEQVPPTGDGLVDLHLLVVLIVDDEGRLVPWVEGRHEWLEVVPVVQKDVGDGGSERQVGSDEVKCVGRGEVRWAKFGVRRRVKSAILENKLP